MAAACEGLLDRIPPTPPDEEEAGLFPDDLFVESRSSPFLEDAEDLVLDATGGAGGFVSLLRFFPNFFFAVGSDDGCAGFVTELISSMEHSQTARWRDGRWRIEQWRVFSSGCLAFAT